MIKPNFGLLCPQRPITIDDHHLMWRRTHMMQKHPANMSCLCGWTIDSRTHVAPTTNKWQRAPRPCGAHAQRNSHTLPSMARHSSTLDELVPRAHGFLIFLQQGEGIGISTSFKHDGSWGWSNA